MGRSRLIAIAATVGGFAVAAFVLVVVLSSRSDRSDRPDDERPDPGSSGHVRMRGVVLVSSEDADLLGAWDHCRPRNPRSPAPGQKVTVTGQDDEPLGTTTLRNATEPDLPRLAALMKAHPDRDQDVGFTEGDPASVLSELRRTQGINCLMQWRATVARSDQYTVGFGGEEYAAYTDDELVSSAFFVETYLGP
jgi:hypothetical protein